MDVLNDIKNAPEQVSIYGNQLLEDQVSVNGVVEIISKIIEDPNAKRWELDWLLIVFMYLSDTLIERIRINSPEEIFNEWFYGTKDSSLLPFRERFVVHVAGEYGEKTQRGNRKTVKTSAKTPLEATTHEILILYKIQSQIKH